MGKLIADKFAAWQEECEQRFQKLKANEEELNRIFIDIYGLQDELTPEVEDKDVTVRRADLTREIKSLLSYAVGCMFGRYSTYKEGLLFAGEPYSLKAFVDKLNERPGTISEEEVERAYHHEGAIFEEMFFPDEDNVIPITDEEYLEDDIIARLCNWLKVVYGADTLEANMDYIAKALGNKGTTSREVIRNYFVNDFFKDHCQTTRSPVPASAPSTGCSTAASRTALRHWSTSTATPRIPSAPCVWTICTRCSVCMNPRSTGCRT